MIEGLVLGESGGPRLLLADQGSHDDGRPVFARLETVPAGPGVGGEAIFTGLFLTTTGDVAATLDITPIISGSNEDGSPFEDELETQQIILEATTERRSITHQLGLSVPLIIGGRELARFAPRATWFRTRLAALVHTEGDLILEGLGVEMEVVREAIPTASPTPASS